MNARHPFFSFLPSESAREFGVHLLVGKMLPMLQSALLGEAERRRLVKVRWQHPAACALPPACWSPTSSCDAQALSWLAPLPPPNDVIKALDRALFKIKELVRAPWRVKHSVRSSFPGRMHHPAPVERCLTDCSAAPELLPFVARPCSCPRSACPPRSCGAGLHPPWTPGPGRCWRPSLWSTPSRWAGAPTARCAGRSRAREFSREQEQQANGACYRLPPAPDSPPQRPPLLPLPPQVHLADWHGTMVVFKKFLRSRGRSCVGHDSQPLDTALARAEEVGWHASPF
jgi:hypothetical protein